MRRSVARFAALVVALLALAPLPAAPSAAEPGEPPHPPLAQPPLLSATFMEYRGGRLHAGIDYKTGGRAGLPVAAPFDGSVTKIWVDENAAGKLLEITRADGLAVRFAHLDAFDEKRLGLERRVHDARRRSGKRYPVDIVLPPGAVKVKRGEIVARSGDTGAGPPHLHLETRRGDMLENPLRHFAEIRDGTRPVIVSARLAPVGPAARVAGLPVPFVWNFADGDAPTVAVHGRFSPTVNAFDRVGDSPNRVALYGFSARLDGGRAIEVACDEYRVGDRALAGRIFDSAISTLSEYHYRAASAPVEIRRPARLAVAASDFAGNRAGAEIRLVPEPDARPVFTVRRDASGPVLIAPGPGLFVLLAGETEVARLPAARAGEHVSYSGKKRPDAARFLGDSGVFSATLPLRDPLPGAPSLDLDLSDGALRVELSAPWPGAARLVLPAERAMERLSARRHLAVLPVAALPVGESRIVVESVPDGDEPVERIALDCLRVDAAARAAEFPGGGARLAWRADAFAAGAAVLIFPRPAPGVAPLAPGARTAFAIRPRTLAAGLLTLELPSPDGEPARGRLIGRVDGRTGYLPTVDTPGGAPRALVGGGDFALLVDRDPPRIDGKRKRTLRVAGIESFAEFKLTDRGSGVPREAIRVTVDGVARDFDRFTEHALLRVPFTRDDKAGARAVVIAAADLAGNAAELRAEVILEATGKAKPEKGGKKDGKPGKKSGKSLAE